MRNRRQGQGKNCCCQRRLRGRRRGDSCLASACSSRQTSVMVNRTSRAICLAWRQLCDSVGLDGGIHAGIQLVHAASHVCGCMQRHLTCGDRTAAAAVVVVAAVVRRSLPAAACGHSMQPAAGEAAVAAVGEAGRMPAAACAVSSSSQP